MDRVNSMNAQKKQVNSVYWHLGSFFISFMIMCGLLVGKVLGSYFTLHASTKLSLAPWAQGAVALGKTSHLSMYVFGVIAGFLYLLISAIWCVCQKDLQNFASRYFKSDYFGRALWTYGILVSNLLLCFLFVLHSDLSIYLLAFSAVWLFGFLLPFLPGLFFPNRAPSNTQKKSGFIIGLLGIVTISICFYISMSPFFAFDKIKISNDFLWMPEKTKLETNADSHSNQLVDNNNYIMSHGLGGLYQESHRDQMNLSRYFSVPSAAVVPTNQMLKLDHILFSDLSISDTNVDQDKKTSHQLVLLKTVGIPPGVSATILKASTGALATPSWPGLSEEEQDFLSKNSFELHNQVTAGHYFYHQYAMLGPITELLWGKPDNKIVYLYGYGNTHLLADLLHRFSPVTFEKYLALSGSFYVFYFLLIIISALIIFRQQLWGLSAIAVSTGCLWLIGFENIQYAPGFNPVRHLLDLPLLVCIYVYLSSQKNVSALLWLVIANLLSLIAVWANTQFGLIMLLSFSGMTVVYWAVARRRQYIDVLIQLISLACGLLIHHWLGAHSAKDGLGTYSVLGVSVAPIAGSLVAAFLILIAVSYLGLFGLLRHKGKSYDKAYLILFTLFYAQCMWLYFVWYTNMGHFIAVSTVWVFGGVLAIKEITHYLSYRLQCSLLRITYVITGLLSLFCLSAGIIYFSNMAGYKQVFKDHYLYQWGFKRAHFVSTMNPKLFQEAVELIHQYASQDFLSAQNSIYIISKYDSLLPFLASKYTAMPYLELATSLASQKEVKRAQQAILQAQPKYLFVDTNIHQSGFGDIVDSTSPTADLINEQGLSYGRVLVMQMLQEVFNGVESNYHLIAQSDLITVYEHK